MQSSRFTIPFLAAAALALVASACGTSPDPVVHGELCTPETAECPTRTTLTRAESGSNILDIAITNDGPPATILFDVDLTSPTDASGDGDAAPAEDPSEGFPVAYRLESGETATDRFGPNEIFVRKQLRLRLGCRACEECDEPCRANLGYTYMTEPLDCDSDGDCRGDRICNGRTGSCVDCVDDGDCGGEQSCDEQTGRCLPPASGGCGHTPAAPLDFGWLLLVGLGWLLLHRRGAARGLAPLVVASAAVVALTVAPTRADARPPQSTLTLELGPRFVTGDLGSDVERGVGLELHETLRWRHVGVDFWIETNYFITNQQAPPLTRELQVFGFGLGPQAYLAIDRVEFLVGAGYQRLGFGPNALVARTGPEANYHSVGGTFGVGYRFSPFVVRTDAQFFPILGADGSLLTINLAFGITTE